MTILEFRKAPNNNHITNSRINNIDNNIETCEIINNTKTNPINV
jgi:hypothetical protein